jgi:hypothetical protein
MALSRTQLTQSKHSVITARTKKGLSKERNSKLIGNWTITSCGK